MSTQAKRKHDAIAVADKPAWIPCPCQGRADMSNPWLDVGYCEQCKGKKVIPNPALTESSALPQVNHKGGR